MWNGGEYLTNMSCSLAAGVCPWIFSPYFEIIKNAAPDLEEKAFIYFPRFVIIAV
jgi:hypothetical protein